MLSLSVGLSVMLVHCAQMAEDIDTIHFAYDENCHQTTALIRFKIGSLSFQSSNQLDTGLSFIVDADDAKDKMNEDDDETPGLFCITLMLLISCYIVIFCLCIAYRYCIFFTFVDMNNGNTLQYS